MTSSDKRLQHKSDNDGREKRSKCVQEEGPFPVLANMVASVLAAFSVNLNITFISSAILNVTLNVMPRVQEDDVQLAQQADQDTAGEQHMVGHDVVGNGLGFQHIDVNFIECCPKCCMHRVQQRERLRSQPC